MRHRFTVTLIAILVVGALTMIGFATGCEEQPGPAPEQYEQGEAPERERPGGYELPPAEPEEEEEEGGEEPLIPME